MQRREQILNLIWIALGGAIIVYSWKMGAWQAGGPATGFMPMLAGSLIFSLGGLQFLQMRGEGADDAPFADSKGIWRVLIVLANLIGFAVLMEPLGFLTTAFLSMLVLLTVIEFRGWLTTITIALASSAGIWWLFTSLDVVLPRGPLGF